MTPPSERIKEALEDPRAVDRLFSLFMSCRGASETHRFVKVLIGYAIEKPHSAAYKDAVAGKVKKCRVCKLPLPNNSMWKHKECLDYIPPMGAGGKRFHKAYVEKHGRVEGHVPGRRPAPHNVPS